MHFLGRLFCEFLLQIPLMFISVKLLLISIFILLSNLVAMGAQDPDPNVAWYESFFEEKPQKPLEETLKIFTTGLNQAKTSGDAQSKAQSLKALALTHLTRTSDYEVAMDLLIQCLAIEDSLDLHEQRIFTYLAMAKVFE
jgi:hypothetical protein